MKIIQNIGLFGMLAFLTVGALLALLAEHEQQVKQDSQYQLEFDRFMISIK